MADRHYLLRVFSRLKMKRVRFEDAISEAIYFGGHRIGAWFYGIEPPVLFIYGLYLELGAPRGTFDALWRRARQLAAVHGFDRIQFDTERPGWRRVLKRFGFETLPVYRMEVRL